MLACQVEVVASTPEDVGAAADGGADRVELCTHLGCGGLTPGRALVQVALEEAKARGIGIRVLVRPREGDFVYSAAERKAILNEAEALMAMGVDRVVTGGLDAAGWPDQDLMSALDRNVGLQCVVFHRALDEVTDADTCAQRLLEAGVQTVLSSGGAVRAVDGIGRIEAWVRSGLEVVAGAGVLPEHAEALIATGVEALHASCRMPKAAQGNGLFDHSRSAVSREQVSRLVDAVRRI
ncbi:MAG: copper homeostasis protein CutC [Flavobacteriales bacterium]|nr:copper homeostasis protein CutC [Flavobacteriales bacterium]